VQHARGLTGNGLDQSGMIVAKGVDRDPDRASR